MSTSKTIKKIDQSKLREQLEEKLADLTKSLRNRDELLIEAQADYLDEVRQAADRDMAVQVMNRNSAQIQNIVSALKKLQNGEYGICEDCEEPIAPKRLQVVPWTKYCLQCQELHDAEGSEGNGWQSFRDAA